MKKTKIALAALTFMLLVLPFFANLASADDLTILESHDLPFVSIEYPTEDTRFATDNITVRVSMHNYYAPYLLSQQVDLYLDGQLCGQPSIDFTSKATVTNGDLALTNLTSGLHTVTAVYWIGLIDLYGENATSVYAYQPTVDFFVAPKVSISSLNEYTTSKPTIKIITDAVGSTVFYSLDGGVNVTLPSQNIGQYDVTLPNLTEGTHTLIAYSNDAYNSTGSAEKIFSVAPESFSVMTIIAGTVAALVVVICVLILIFYRKTNLKRKFA